MADENGDPYLMMVLFGHSDWREGLAENGSLSAFDSTWDALIGGAVEKREVFLEKRSSAPGRILFETHEIDGEVWRYGYDHTGELVHVGVALPEIK